MTASSLSSDNRTTVPFAAPLTATSRTASTTADRELQERVLLFIKQRQLARGSNLTVLARRGVVTLLGVEPTFHQRQLLHSHVRRVAGVVEIQDDLEVATPTYQVSVSPRFAAGAVALAEC